MRNRAWSLVGVALLSAPAWGQVIVGNGSSAGGSFIYAIDVINGAPPRQLTSAATPVYALAANNATGTLYWLNTGGAAQQLFSAPMTATGFLTPSAGIVLSGVTLPIAGLAWDSVDNVLIGWSEVGSRFVSINTSTGVCTDLGPALGALGGLDFDPATNAFYASNDSTSTTAPLAGAGIYRINKPLSAPTYTRLSAYPAGEADVDGLAVGNGRVYLVNDTPAQPIYVYNLATNAYETPITNPLTFNGAVSGGTWAPALTLPPAPPRTVSEMEPNETKDTASCVLNLADGQAFTGVSTGSSTTTPGLASADTFLVGGTRTTPGIYRHELRLYSFVGGHTTTIRGLTQSLGVVNTTSDATMQTGAIQPDASRLNAWYDFGSRGQVVYRVAGTASTTSDYLVLHEVVPVTPFDAGQYIEGSIAIVGEVSGSATYDADWWVYDSAFHPVSTFGHDDLDPTSIARTLAPGTYYLALSSFNFANDQPAATDDTFRSGAVLDFSGAAIAGSPTTATTTYRFSIADGAGPRPFVVPASLPFEVVWVRFQVVPTCQADTDDGSGTGTPDGGVTIDDLLYYLLRFEGGC